DLSGMDVGRKALILARLLGYPGELPRSSVESLVPNWARKLSLPEFLDRLEQLDAGWKRRVDAAAAAGTVLRYVATATRTKIAVGLRAVPSSSPLAAIKGSDNQVVFTTARYKANPLVITGPGAGAEVTAAGVLNDILRLAGAWGRLLSRRSAPAGWAPSDRGSTCWASPWRARATKCAPNGPASRAFSCATR